MRTNRVITHQNYPAYQMKDMLKVVYGDSLPQMRTNKDAMAFVRPMSDELREIWNQSGQTAYEIYRDPRYVAEGFISFYEVSHECHKVIGKLAQDGLNGIFEPFDPKEKSFFDLYNGIGLGTIHLAAMGFDVYVHNDNPEQTATMRKLFDHFELQHPTELNEKQWRNRQFDFVSSFEVLEHFKDPVQITRDLARAVKSGGMFIESTGFAVGTYPGHFVEYEIGGVKMDGRQASKAVVKTLQEEGLTKKFTGFSCKPRIWTKSF